MAVEWDTGDDFSSGNTFLDQDGWYHLVVAAATDRPTKNDGTLIDNAMFRVDCTVAAGTSPGCKDKTVDLVFFYPRPDAKNAGAFARKKVDRALIALNVIDPEDRAKKITIDPRQMEGQQFIAKLVKEEGQKFLSLSFADIYHVDDPEVAGQPKNEQMLKLIPAEHRRVGNRPKPSPDPNSARTQAASPSPPREPEPAKQAQAEPMDLDSLDI